MISARTQATPHLMEEQRGPPNSTHEVAAELVWKSDLRMKEAT